ncbi:MAG: hypothetical protein ACK55I_05830, partial [bacterium]
HRRPRPRPRPRPDAHRALHPLRPVAGRGLPADRRRGAGARRSDRAGASGRSRRGVPEMPGEGSRRSLSLGRRTGGRSRPLPRGPAHARTAGLPRRTRPTLDAASPRPRRRHRGGDDGGPSRGRGPPGTD